MATQLRIKRRTADANAPAGLTAGEMAINLFDKKLYVGGTAGTNIIFLDSTAVAGLSTANTFTQLNTFSAGISASGATFTGLISGATATFSKDITVNSMTVGLGGGGSSSNIALGQSALVSNTDGTGNVAIGGSALGNNTEGISNVALGGSALYNNTIGSNNIAIGAAAMYWSTESENNVAIGANVMSSAFGYAPGSYNTAIGNESLRSGGFTGNSNVAIGYAAAYEDTTGSHNVAIGFESLRNNSTGLYNTSVGSGALRHGNSITVQLGGSQMTALGYGAGRYRGTGTSALTTGTGGIYIGYQARGSTLAQTNEIVIGVNALGLGSNTAVIGATLQSAATIYGVLNLPSGLSASGATLSGTVITSEKVNAITSARTVTVNFQDGNIQTLTGLGSGATGSSAIGFTGASATGSSTVTMIITNGGLMTSNTTFWSTAVKWPGGFKTTLSTSGVDILTFTTIDAGTNIYGMLGGKAFS